MKLLFSGDRLALVVIFELVKAVVKLLISEDSVAFAIVFELGKAVV